MAGAKRLIQAAMARTGKRGSDAPAAFTPEKIRTTKGTKK